MGRFTGAECVSPKVGGIDVKGAGGDNRGHPGTHSRQPPPPHRQEGKDCKVPERLTVLWNPPGAPAPCAARWGVCVCVFIPPLTLRLLLLCSRGGVVSALLHGPQDVFVVRIQVVVEAQEVKLGVGGLLGLQHNLKLRPLLTDEARCPLDDIMGLDGRWLRNRSPEMTNPFMISLLRHRAPTWTKRFAADCPLKHPRKPLLFPA